MSISDQYDNAEGTACNLLKHYLLDIHHDVCSDPDCYSEVEQLVEAIMQIAKNAAKEEVKEHEERIHDLDEDGYKIHGVHVSFD